MLYLYIFAFIFFLTAYFSWRISLILTALSICPTPWAMVAERFLRDRRVCASMHWCLCVSPGDGCHPSSVSLPLGWQQQTEAALPGCSSAVGGRMERVCMRLCWWCGVIRSHVWSSEPKTLSANSLPTVSFLCFTLPTCTLGKSKLWVEVPKTLIETVWPLQRLPLQVPQGLVFNFT